MSRRNDLHVKNANEENGKPCIPIVNQRIPRGRAGGRTKNENLHERIERLEGLIRTYFRHQKSTEGAVASSGAVAARAVEPTGNYQFLGTAFWTSLQDELEQLETDLDDGRFVSLTDDLDSASPEAERGVSRSGTDPIFGTISGSDALRPPLPMLSAHLCGVYFRNVDPIFKVLHTPSVRAHIEDGLPYLDYSRGHGSVTALVYVIYYAAVCTMGEEECARTLWQSRTQAVDHFREMAEVALARADYIVTEELTTLQALVIFLAVQRQEDHSRRTWTTTAVAVRIALAIGLQRQATRHDAFDTQQRRRTWHALCTLDLNLAVDLASDRLIAPERSVVPLPMNINDSDISLGSTEVVLPQNGWTDMSFSLMLYEIGQRAHRAHAINSELWEQRQEVIHTLDESIQQRYLDHCDPEIPLQAFAIAVARSTLGACRLHSLRGTSEPITPGPLPSVHSDNVLLIAVDTLSYSRECHTDARMAGWRWTLWTHWHAIAVAFAAMTTITTGALADRAWEVVEPSFQHLLAVDGGGQRGQMCRPLEKLAYRARKARAAAIGTELGQQGSAQDMLQADSYSTSTDSLYYSPIHMEDWGLLSSFSVPFFDGTGSQS
ncbi:hypothetical protein LTR95_018285 [Oleoguttula sp. CCFEE 5521]